MNNIYVGVCTDNHNVNNTYLGSTEQSWGYNCYDGSIWNNNTKSDVGL